MGSPTIKYTQYADADAHGHPETAWCAHVHVLRLVLSTELTMPTLALMQLDNLDGTVPRHCTGHGRVCW